MTTIARSKAVAQRPLKTETHRVELEAVEPLKCYLRHYHPRAWWVFRELDEFGPIFEASKSLADVVYAFLCGWRSAGEGWEEDES